MKKNSFIILLALFTCLLFSLPRYVVAQGTPPSYVGGVATQLESVAGEQGANFGEARDPRKIVTDTLQVALSFLGIITLVMIIYAGFVWMMSAGEEEKIKTAQKTLKYAIIGFVIVMMSYSITVFVKNYLDIAGSAYGPGGSGYWEVQWGVKEDVSDFYPNQDPYGGTTFDTSEGLWGTGGVKSY